MISFFLGQVLCCLGKHDFHETVPSRLPRSSPRFICMRCSVVKRP